MFEGVKGFQQLVLTSQVLHYGLLLFAAVLCGTIWVKWIEPWLDRPKSM